MIFAYTVVATKEWPPIASSAANFAIVFSDSA